MTIAHVLPKYRFSYGTLAALGDTALSLRIRDEAILETYGIDIVFNDNLTAKLAEFRAFPSDPELLGEEVDKREVKDENAKQTRIQIREIMSRVVNVYPVGSGKWILFGTKGLDDKSDKDLSRVGERVARVATKYIANLAGKGVTPIMISALTDVCALLYTSVDEFHDAELLRISTTTERIVLGNQLYGMINEMFGYGKNYWSTRNASMYQAYVIYNTPSGTPELSGTTGTVHGIMKDSVTLQPIAGGMVSLEFIDNPVVTDANGLWTCPNVPIECNTIWGMAAGHKLLKDDITVVANVDINFDIMMVAGS